MYKRLRLFFLTITALSVFWTVNVYCVGTLFAQVPIAVSVPADDEDDDANKDNPNGKNPESDRLLTHQDRAVLRRIEQAGLLIERERFTEATQLIANLFEQVDDRFVKPSESESSNPTNHTTQRDQVVELFNRLPEKSRQLYVTQWEPQAQRLLEIAVSEQSIAKVESVATKYPMTESGRDALFLIGMTHWSSGAKAAALRIFTELSANSPNPQKYEPELTLNIINCQQSLGLTTEASKTAETFFIRFKTPRLTRSDGSIWTPESPADLLNALTSNTSPPDVSRWIDNVGWLLPKGTAWQNVSVNASEPILEKNWFVPSSSDFQIGQQLQRIQQSFQKLRNTVNLPASEPIVVRDMLLVRGSNEIVAINSRNGKRIWQASEPGYVIPKIGSRSMRLSGDGYSTQGRYVEGMIRFLFWFDRLHGGITSDGKRIFHIDGNTLSTYTIGRQAQIQEGGLMMEDPRYSLANTLYARDVETGKLLWSVGKYPFAQKKFDEFAERVNDAAQRKEAERRRREEERRNANKNATKNNDEKNNNGNDTAENKEDNQPAEKPFVSSVVFTENEKILGEQTFLGAPLPVQDRLFVIAESGGTIRLLILNAATGDLIKQQPIVDPPNPFESDYLRRLYSTTPSYSNGLVICPTGVGVIAAFDALTAEPVWCFQYAKENDKKDGERQNANWNMRGVPLAMMTDQLMYLLTVAGWQIPSIIIDGNHVIVAPADQPALFSLDLLTGNVVWENKNMSRAGMLYIAGIHDGKIITVTPESLVAIDVTNGKPIWNDDALRLQAEQHPGMRNSRVVPRPIPIPRAIPAKAQQPANNESGNKGNKETEPRKELVTLALPKDVKPAGRGILDGNRYYLPLSDESIAMFNLDEVKLESVRKPTASFFTNDNAASTGANSLGNLIALRGKFFSKSPFGVACFDQLEALVTQTKTRLAANPADAEALFDSGRVVYSEGKIPEAIDLVKRSATANRSPRTLKFLRGILLSAIRMDFKSYRSYYDELLTLAMSQTEEAETLLVFGNGARENGDDAAFFTSLERLIHIDQQSQAMTLRVDQDRSVRLSRIIGEQTSAVSNAAKTAGETSEQRQQLRSQIELLANNIYEQIIAGKTFGNVDQITETESDRLFDLVWNEDVKTVNNPFIRAWRLFLDYFPDLPITSRAKQKLFDVCENTNQYLTLELLGSEMPNWFGSGINLTGENPLASEEVPPRRNDDSVAKTSQIPSHDAASMILKLAKLTYDKSVALQREDLLTDSLYDYRMLIDSYPAEKDIVAAATDALKIKHYEQFTNIENWTVNGANDEVGGGSPGTLKGMIPNNINNNYIQSGYHAAPHLGSWNPYFSNKTFRYENVNQPNNRVIVCQDERGIDQWFLQLPQTADNENNMVMDTSGQQEGMLHVYSYFRSLGHLLFLVRGKQIIAIDTFDRDETDSPRILWEKSRDTMLATFVQLNGQQINELRQMYERNNMHQQYGGHIIGGGFFGGNNVYISPKAVCYQSMGTIIAVDPLTGQMLWQRRCESSSEEMTGDNETLFRVLMDSHEVIAVDPASGKEISRSKLPEGAVVHLFENNLVLLTSDVSFKLEVIDLRAMLQPVNERKLALKLPTDFHQVAVHRFNPVEIRSGLADSSIVRFVHHGRFVATLNVQSKTLKIFDLTSKANVCRPIKVETIKDEDQNNGWGIIDFEVQFRNDKILVMYIPRRHINNDGKSPQRQAVRGIPSRSVGLGTVMLYDRDGKTQWEKPVEINNWFYFTKTPSYLPVLMFGVLERPKVATSGTQYQTAIKLIDKTTGKEVFSRTLKRVTSRNQAESYLHSFRVYVQKHSEIDKGSIHLYSQYQQASYKFDLTDEPTKPITDQEKKPPSLNLGLEFNWDWN